MEQERVQLDNINVIKNPAFKRPTGSAEKMSAHPKLKVDNFPACKYCGTSHMWGREHCPAYGKNCNACGTANHFTRVCNKTKRKDSKLNAVEELSVDREGTVLVSNEVSAAESIGAVRTRGKKWFFQSSVQWKITAMPD